MAQAGIHCGLHGAEHKSQELQLCASVQAVTGTQHLGKESFVVGDHLKLPPQSIAVEALQSWPAAAVYLQV